MKSAYERMERNNKIKKLYFNENVPLAKIAKNYNLSHISIYRIVNQLPKSHVLLINDFTCDRANKILEQNDAKYRRIYASVSPC